ncbi:Bestrophin-2-like 6 [Homarus americanus]|uniref:Bestrophin homolog n=1 Tax=Homarus americanus TaxID=6706 RepID=A0A8J5JKW7_HOMAM|nr:Bestrophin-2-like 6 [Homarus americanus]
MTTNEQKIFDALDAKTSHPKYWMPLVWAGSIITRARKEGRIRDDFAVKTIIDEINRFRGLCGGLLSYDWISIPLVYTQVVTLAVYSFFLATIMGRQFLDPKQNLDKYNVDFYVPVFTFLQFFFYMGWLKVAESLVNPFGEDDDDFEVNWLVDRNLQVSYLIVDEMHCEHPELIQDMYWDEVFPQELPYTIASEAYRREPPQGSTANIEVPETEQEFLPMMEEEVDEGIDASMSCLKVDMENGESKAIDILKKKGISNSTYGIASSQPIPSRKPSMLSMLWHRMKSESHDNVRHLTVRPNASTTSFRQRRQRDLRRSSSRMSTSSQVTSRSPETFARNPTIATQDSAIFRMSDLSLDGQTPDVSSPRHKGRNSYDYDEPILIKIKRRDKDELLQEDRRGQSTINLKGFTKMISQTKSFHGEPSASSSPIKSSSGFLASGTSNPEQISHAGYDSKASRSYKQDGACTSEPASPSPRSLEKHWQTTQSLATLDASNTNSGKINAVAPLTSANLEESSLYKPFSGDLNVFAVGTSPEVYSPEEMFGCQKVEQIAVNIDNVELSGAKDIPVLETIIEGPLETISEDNLDHVNEGRNIIVSESELGLTLETNNNNISNQEN